MRAQVSGRGRGVVTAVMAAALALAVVVAASPGQAAPAKQLALPKNVVATATSKTAISVSFSAVPNASSYTVLVFGESGQNSQEFRDALPTGTVIDGLSVCTTYRVAVQAISASRSLLNSVVSGKVTVATQCNEALVPDFGTPASTSDGFTVQIENYDADFAWAGSVTAGSVSIDDTGLAAVTGLTSDASQTLTVTTTRATYDNGSAKVTGARNTNPTRWIGSGDFTMEFWVKPTIDYSSVGRQELMVLTADANHRLDIWYQGGEWSAYADGALTAGQAVPGPFAASPPPVGTWTHVALSRSGGTMNLYVNGARLGQSSGSGDLSHLNKVLLGGDPTGCTCNVSTGLLSNVRIVDGTALYTAASITVPTTPVAAVAGTTFLLNNALGDPSVGSVVLDGSTRYEQTITTDSGVTTVSPLNAYTIKSGAWSESTVVTSAQAPQKSCGSNGLRASGALCQVGDDGPGGGTIFYSSSTAFTSTGSPCGTSCHYLEVAPPGWASLQDWPNDVTVNGQIVQPRTDANVDPILVWSDGAFTGVAPGAIAVGTAIGTGMQNTVQIRDNTVTTDKPQRFAFDAALNYAGTGAAAGQWFLPSIGELNELCKFARGQVADLGTAAQCSNSVSLSLNTALGLTAYEVYWSSSYDFLGNIGQTPGYCFTTACPNAGAVPGTTYNGYYSSYGVRVRPVRAS